jgi:transcription elongation factor Elf1
MSKVSKECPNCGSNFIVLMKNEGKNIAWPACWNCSSLVSKEEEKTLHIDLNINSHLKGNDLFKEAVQIWEEYIDLLYEEKKIKKTGEN